MLTTLPRLPRPSHCVLCEFSFCIDSREDYNLHCCTLFNTHVSGRAALCPARKKMTYDKLQTTLNIIVPPWQIADRIQHLGDTRTLETIRNQIAEQTGLKLASIERFEDENAHEEKSP